MTHKIFQLGVWLADIEEFCISSSHGHFDKLPAQDFLCPVYLYKSHAPVPAHNDSWMINYHHPRHRPLPTISPMASRLTLPCEHQWGFNWHQSSGPALWRHFAPMITGSVAAATDRIRGPPKLPVDLWEGLGIGCPLGSTVDNRP